MRRCLLLVAVLPLAFAPAPFPKRNSGPSETGLKALQGEWVRTSSVIGGTRETLAGDDDTVTILGGRLTYANAGHGTWAITLHDRETPARIDLEPVVANQGFLSSHGIYELQGDTLTICFVAVEEGARPAAFDDPGKDVWLEVFKRKKR